MSIHVPAAAPTPDPAASAGRDPLFLIRWLDCILVVLAAPFVIAFGAPVLGYVVAAIAWVAQRLLGYWVEKRARTREDVRAQIGLNLASIIGRAWLIGLTILAVGLAGERSDGAMAAGTILVAFSFYFGMNLLLRSLERKARA